MDTVVGPGDCCMIGLYGSRIILSRLGGAKKSAKIDSSSALRRTTNALDNPVTYPAVDPAGRKKRTVRDERVSFYRADKRGRDPP